MNEYVPETNFFRGRVEVELDDVSVHASSEEDCGKLIMAKNLH